MNPRDATPIAVAPTVVMVPVDRSEHSRRALPLPDVLAGASGCRRSCDDR